ncbi:Oligopeptide transport ATP-binding protein OppF (TC 3.A.1.5.1) [hydrothermal vent metagenome]|uniref:Oligopeptide transport ATP-binding protein OppF (TC 3.A.1.5.1) n=1 Tax=hydrothermal vent metagenome TaxID=652676 RepID=A0A3B0VGD9_9ZZZZ
MGLTRKAYHQQSKDGAELQPLLHLHQLSKHFPIRGGVLRRQIGVLKAVDLVNLSLFPNETVTLVGGAGDGKSILARTTLHLMPSTSGKVLFNGELFTRMGRAARQLARQQMQLTMQDPYTSLNPHLRVKDILAEPLKIHKLGDGRFQAERIDELLQLVGLNPYFAGRFPHEFSGGQRQRINIARALATNPLLLVADDPLAVLDTAVQAPIVALLAELKQKLNLTLLLLVSDLAYVRSISDRIGVLFMGQIVELTDTESIYERPLHPYTQYIHSKTQQIDPVDNEHIQPIQLTGPAPNPTNPPSGCRFRTQCPYASEVCQDEVPPLRDLGKPAQPHLIACHHAERFQG